MDRDAVLRRCGELPGAVETYPFGDDVTVFKVGGRVFALCHLDGHPGMVSLKCEPPLAEALRARYPAVRPGYHLNKRHWNTIDLDGTVPGDELAELIDHSWELVVAKLPRRQRDALAPPLTSAGRRATGWRDRGPDRVRYHGVSGARSRNGR